MNSSKPIGQDSKRTKFTRLQIIKNLFIICLTFVLLFTAYDGLSMLQSTMNRKQGMGSYSQSVVFFVFALSCLFVPNYSIKKLGCKTNLFIGTTMYLPYIASNVYPTWATMMSSAVLLGFGSGILWAAQCTYFNEAACLYSELLNDCAEDEKTAIKGIKSNIKNPKLFVIQNGISERLFSEMVPKQMDYDSGTDLKFEILKLNSKNDPESKNDVINTKLDCEDAMIDTKIENNMSVNDASHIIEHDKPVSVTDTTTLENIDSNTEQFIRSEHLNHNVTSNVKRSNNEGIFHTDIAEDNTPPPSIDCTIDKGNTHRSSTIESVTARFFGFFGLMYCTAQIWSNLITYYVLNKSSEQNKTHTLSYSCGASFCNSEYGEAFSSVVDEIPLDTRYLLIGITLTLSVLASLLLFIFLDPLNSRGETVTFSFSHLMAVFNHLRKKEQIFLVPLSVFSGMSQGFFTADFTKSYVQCAWDISHVGLAAVVYGLTSGLSSSMSGWAVKYVGRVPVVLFGLVFHLGMEVFLLLWNPDSENPAMFYLAAGLCGAVVGLFYSQIQAFYGLLFKNEDETAFATHYFCCGMGFTLSFIYSDYFCTSIKIYVLMIISCVGVVGYLAADRHYISREQSNK